jgi:[ribosomal protein S18]-alanine N-acetyltransferase
VYNWGLCFELGILLVTALQLQEMTPDQLPAVLELDQICFGGLWTQDGYQRELESPNSDLLVLTAPELIGIGCYWAIVDEAHITIVGIHPNHRRQGLGQLMLLALLHRAQRREMARATLEVRISNESAIKLYQKLGFKIAGQRKGYYGDTGEDALILWLGELQTAAFTERFKNFWKETCDRLKQQQTELVIQTNLLSIENSSLTCP